MSKDFELLQRLEREWGRPSTFAETSNYSVPAQTQNGIFNVVQAHASAVAHPSAHLTSVARAELHKLIIRTFLATPSVSTIMFTGVEAQQSAKWLAACTADLLAIASRARVCLIDSDLNSPAMHQAFSIPNENGLAAILSGACSVENAAICVADNLWIIPAGARSDGQRVDADAMRNLFSDLLQECEYLVVSSPNYESSRDIAGIGTVAEGAVVVLDSATTRRSSAQRAKAMLESAQVKVIGSVLANQRYPIPEFLYARM